MCQDMILDYRQQLRGVRHINSVPHANTVKNEEAIQRNWDRLDMGLITPKMFVERMKYRAGGGKLLILGDPITFRAIDVRIRHTGAISFTNIHG